MSALRELGGALGLGLEPVVGAVLHDEGLILSSIKITKKETNLERLLFWRSTLPRTFTKDDIKQLSKEIIAATSTMHGERTDIALAIPTRYLTLASVKAEFQDKKQMALEMAESLKDFFEDLDQDGKLKIPDGVSLFHEIIDNDKKLDIFNARLAWINEDDLTPYLQLLRSSGLNPTVIDVQIFALANYYVFLQKEKKDLFLKPIIFWEINAHDSYAMIVRRDRWELVEVNLHPSDIALLAQLPNLATINHDGFWGELFDRIADELSPVFKALGKWDGEKALDTVVIHSTFTNLEHLQRYLKEKDDLKTHLLSLPENFSVSESASKYYDADNIYSRYLCSFGVALRTMNPFSVPKLPNEYFRLNYLPEWQEIADTRVNKLMLKGLQRTLIFVFVMLLGYCGWMGSQILLDRPTDDRIALEKVQEDQKRTLNSLKVQLKREESIYQSLFPDQIGKDKLAVFWSVLAEQIPKSASLDKVEFIADGNNKNTIMISGLALDDASIIEIEQNIKRNLTRLVNVKEKPKTIRSDDIADPIAYSWEFTLK